MRIEELLQNSLASLPESNVKNAMMYSLMAGGKRIRPLLLYETLKGYGIDETLGDECACALEMIHTYSLIHDDLPAMDNDDLRRGKPTCHKQFDEATAILAGDGLLTYAFSCILSSKLPAEVKAGCAKILADMAGSGGMVLGQDLDMREQTGVTTWDDLKTVHRYKTGCLLSAPLMMGALISGHGDDVDQWHEIGNMIGLAFQIQDDVLDVELTAEEFGKSNSDSRNEKVTSVTVLGKADAEAEMNALYAKSIESIGKLRGFDPAGMAAMIVAIQKRRK